MGHSDRHRADLAEEKYQRGAWVYLVAEGFEYSETGYADCRKFEHIAVNSETGETHRIDFNPYREIPVETFDHLVALAFDVGPRMSPMDAAEVARLHAAETAHA